MGDATKKNANICLGIYRFLQEKISNVSGKDIRKNALTFASWLLETSFTLGYKCRREVGLSREIQK